MGNMKKTFDGKTPLEAADKAYKSISKYFNNDVPRFYFTLQEGAVNMEDSEPVMMGGSNKLHHFVVKEKKEGKDASYNISEFSPKNNDHLAKFVSKLNDFKTKQSGGLRGMDDSNSSPSDSSDSNPKDSSSDLDELNFTGGGKKWNNSSSSSSSESSDWMDDGEDFYHRKTYKLAPISYWWYDPQVYFLKKIYIPTFVSTVTPYVQLELYF